MLILVVIDVIDHGRQCGGLTRTGGPGDQYQTARHSAYVLKDVDRKSTRLNSSHVAISYAVFCLKKKNGAPLERGDREEAVLGDALDQRPAIHELDGHATHD